MTARAGERLSPPPPTTLPLPRGRLRFRLHRHALLRGSGLDVRPLAALHVATPHRDAPDATPDAVAREHQQALATALRVVRELMARPRVRQAVGISNPVFHDVALAEGRPLVSSVPYSALNGRGRRQVRTAHRYIRRLLAKTETNSYFGPTLALTWDDRVDEGVRVAAAGPERCVLGISHWVTTEIARRLRRELPAAERAWRRDPLWLCSGTELSCAMTGRRIPLTAAATAVWEALATPRCPRELAAVSGLAPAATSAALLLIAPALRPWPEPPATLVDGLAWLERTFPGRPLVAELAQLVARATPDADPLAVRADIRAAVAGAGLATSRASGQHYADRDVISEDRASPWSDRLCFGAPATASVNRALGHGLPLLTLAALLRQADAREAVRRHLAGSAVGLVELAGRRIPPVTRRADALAACLDALVPDAGTGEVRWDPARVAAATAPLWDGLEPLPDDQFGCLPGVDLMSAGGGPGAGAWVLSECHDDSSSALGGITSRVQPPGRFPEFTAAVERWLDTGRLATIVGRRRSRHITPELPGLAIELSGVSAAPRERVAAAAEVEVSADGARAVYRGRRYQLYPGDVPGPLFAALSLPCVTPVAVGARSPVTPRVVLGDLVLQRRMWRVRLPALGGGLTAWRTARAWQREWGMPDRVFLRHPAEPKPLLVDFGDALAVEDLGRLEPTRVTCSEVLPELSDTWWRLPAPQPAELRLPVLVRWEPGPGRRT
ncbi:lantibiotic dehydratase [Streptomyces litchfieldiae]|uniref:Lantibiotic dehydratase n=1 Tax=Streptomyces litchfieldiae TaxID=3075543 RepID=A0ABU2MPS6_9ACTN|nr:lantibiotic dehydratase [Streptomyces sp. DSM 44938]MDT0343609.1 lantibiotic dehydratase [Streptomyces sp. DSM 44938]